MNPSAKALLSLLACCLLVSAAHAQPRFRPAAIPSDDPSIENPALTYTAEDLADPPPGEIRKGYVTHDVKDLRAALATNLSVAPAGPEGKDSPWMPKFQAVLAGLDQIIKTRLQRDVFRIIPKMQEIFAAKETPGFSEYFKEQRQLLFSLGVTVYHAIAEHVSDQNAQVAAADLALFVQVFVDGGFYFGSDWEDELVPIDGFGPGGWVTG